MELDSPPSEELLGRAAEEGWRLVGVVLDGEEFLAYFERSRIEDLSRSVEELSAATPSSLFKALHGRMAGMFQSHTGSPELESLADGLDRLNRVFLEMLRDRLGSEELQRLAETDPKLAEALDDLEPPAED